MFKEDVEVIEKIEVEFNHVINRNRRQHMWASDEVCAALRVKPTYKHD